MVLIYVKSGEWMSSCSEEWSFVVDKERRGRMVTLETTTPLEKLKMMVCKDYGVDHNVVNAEFSYSLLNQRGNSPIIITNDRQASNFVGYAKRDSSTTLCVTFSGIVIVSTPQDVALADANSGISMFDKVRVPVLPINCREVPKDCPEEKEGSFRVLISLDQFIQDIEVGFWDLKSWYQDEDLEGIKGVPDIGYGFRARIAGPV
ncbi:hypothetical protein F2Q69_00008072 [Brassica cretica]|uniref:Uncharacterized protein n=1 Tax=Brassica cretica TaxID=69181 RepID=A0A8S9PLY9_BRACR|nr:hypothetical protein F2Q69_00008072 [Brassica cretica]